MLIIEHAKSEENSGIRKRGNGEYYEAHHILPKSLFPLWINRKSNKVLLTAREHFFCHQLLTKIYPCEKMFRALAIFCKYKQKQRKLTSRQYEICRKAPHEANLRWWAEPNNKAKASANMKGKADRSFTQSYAYKKQVSERAKKSKWYNDGVNEYFTDSPKPNWLIGRLKKSEEEREAITKKTAETRKNRSEEEKQKEFENRSRASKEKLKYMTIVYKKGNHWYNNGIENKKAFSCPPGWQKGKLHKKELKKVICVETGEILYSKDVPEAHKVCNGYKKTYKGYHWKWYNLEGGVSENFDSPRCSR